jgi:hypothetical protein
MMVLLWDTLRWHYVKHADDEAFLNDIGNMSYAYSVAGLQTRMTNTTAVYLTQLWAGSLEKRTVDCWRGTEMSLRHHVEGRWVPGVPADVFSADANRPLPKVMTDKP